MPAKQDREEAQSIAQPEAMSVGQRGDTADAAIHSPYAEAVLERIVDAARTLTGADGAAILLYDRDTERFVPAAARNLDDGWLQGPGLMAAQSLAQRAMETAAIVDMSDTTALAELDLPRLQGQRRPSAAGAAALTADGAVVGVLSVYHLHPRARPLDTGALSAFAALAGMAIADARAHARERTLRTRLEALDEATKALAAELSPGRVLQRIVEIAVSLAGARYGALGVIGADGYLSDFITTGIGDEERERIGPLPRGHGLLGVLIRQGEPLRVPDIAADARRVGFPPNHPPMTSLLGVPIRAHNEIVGDLYLTDKIGADAFSDEDQRLIEMLAAHAGVAIQNARLYEQVGELTLLRERERIGRDLHDGIIQDIYAATLQLDDIAEDIADIKTHNRLLGVSDHLTIVIGNVRTYIQGLRARELEGRLLSEGITTLVKEVNARGELRATSAIEGDIYRLPDGTANTVLHIAREALSNVVRHAGAAHVHVRLAYSPSGVLLSVTDDGCGFDLNSPRGEEHRGLRNLRTRADEAQGWFDVDSQLGEGTTVRAFIPTPS